MNIYAYRGEKVTRADTGEHICTLAEDATPSSRLDRQHFTDWQIDEPPYAAPFDPIWLRRVPDVGFDLHLDRGWMRETPLPSKRPVVELD